METITGIDAPYSKSRRLEGRGLSWRFVCAVVERITKECNRLKSFRYHLKLVKLNIRPCPFMFISFLLTIVTITC
jgi:hypothetical protein